jgi:hypothetical protein
MFGCQALGRFEFGCQALLLFMIRFEYAPQSIIPFADQSGRGLLALGCFRRECVLVLGFARSALAVERAAGRGQQGLVFRLRVTDCLLDSFFTALSLGAILDLGARGSALVAGFDLRAMLHTFQRACPQLPEHFRLTSGKQQGWNEFGRCCLGHGSGDQFK